MMGAVPTLLKVVFFNRNKAAEKWLHENKNSREMLMTTLLVNLIVVKIVKIVV